MDSILSFLADNYKYFMIAAVVLLLALIGFIVDGKKKKKNEEVVPVPNADAQAQAAQGMAPTQPVQPQPAAPALATEQTQTEPGLVIEEPSLNNIEPASQELNLDASVQEEQGSIFGTPEMQAPAAVETTAPDPATVEGPTLVIEDKEETTTPEMTAPTVEPVAPTPTETVVPEVAPITPVATPVVEPITQASAPVAPTMTAPEMPTAPAAASTTPETPIQQ